MGIAELGQYSGRINEEAGSLSLEKVGTVQRGHLKGEVRGHPEDSRDQRR